MKIFAQKKPEKQRSSSFSWSNTTMPASPRLGHDSRRIPIHPPPAEAIQTQSAIDQGQQERLQTKQIGSSDSGHTAVPPIVHEILHSPGQPLDPASRLFMELRFGHDFSQLRVHTDAKAAESAQTIGAAAYTVGNDVAFGAGEFNPQSSDGRHLIAHELTHVVQQSKGSRNLQRQPRRKGKVVRVERPRKSRPQPPGPGTFTEEQLRAWYDSHPKAKLKSVDKVNGKRTQAEAYTPETLWVKGYFYALTNVFGDSGTEVWLNDDGDGKVIGIDREIP